MQTNFSYIFYLKKPKHYVSGSIPVYMRITVNSKRTELSIGRECLPEHWHPKVGMIAGTKEEIKTFNNYLSTLALKLEAIHTALIAAGEQITIEVLKNKLEGKQERARMNASSHSPVQYTYVSG